MKKFVFFGLLLVGLLSGCTLPDNSTGTGTQILPCPYDCCNNAKYELKGCTAGKECVDFACTEKACPYECCDGYTFLRRDCAFNQECRNNQCVTAHCPYECCTGETYLRKDCSEGWQCLNNKCSEIPKPKISVLVDACLTSQNIMQGLGEVTDIYLTIENYGTKEAADLNLSATANDIETIMAASHGTMTALPAKSQKKVKLTIDTDSATPTTASVTAACPECDPLTVTATEENCHYDIGKMLETASKYLPVVGGLIG
ncbi:MAG: hypothetical protein NT067_05255 [Candidatus Diapherotrites archaeon]|nr:hypothetical protein [Candidatus Diapherotrites archaeon]